MASFLKDSVSENARNHRWYEKCFSESPFSERITQSKKKKKYVKFHPVSFCGVIGGAGGVDQWNMLKQYY